MRDDGAQVAIDFELSFAAGAFDFEEFSGHEDYISAL
jgi:hypothetical protein